jgi:hypothetical protein
VIKRLLFSTSLVLLVVGIVCAQGSDQKENILSARQALKEAPRNRKLCDKLGFPASLRDNRCYSLYPNELSTWGKGFSDGLAKVTVNGKVGFIDSSGKLVIAAKLRDAGPFSEGLAPYESGNGKWGYLDKRGKVAINPEFDWAISFHEGVALVQVGKNWGYIGRNGIFVIEPKFEEAESFSEGFASVSMYDTEIEWTGSTPRKGRWVRRFIDKKGRTVLDKGFDRISRGFNGGMALVDRSLGYSEKHKGMISETYLIDTKGNALWTLDSWYIASFSDDVIIVAVGKDGEGQDQYSFVDRRGKRLTDKTFSYLTGFSEGLSGARATWTGMHGYIDKTGSFVIEPQFGWAKSFSEGLAAVEEPHGLYGFIDKTGKWVIEPRFRWVDDFQNGYALFLERDKAGYVDRRGTVIWQPTN